ncbi:MAG: caspase family protein [Actinomycetota bacterium]|nr:caspase family protein [Actinomycetota bacterium]
MAGQRIALIVANDEYEHEGLRRLSAPAADAEALARVLGDSQIGGFAVRVVHNEPSHRISTHIEDLFAERRPDDVLLLHFSGHGLKSESGELFFAAPNTRPNRLGSTAVSADFVQRCMRECRSRSVVLLLDCCYGGAFGRGVTVRASGDANVLDSFSGKPGGGRGRAVITASSAMEYAFEGDELAEDQAQRPSVFTSAVVDGLASGDADRDEDGWVSLNELYDYVFDRVRERNPHQTPSRDVEMQGELYLARSRRRRIVASPIPPDVQVAIKDPNMFTRLGAVTELGPRLASEDLSAALGAYQALTDVARSDIQYVADAAQAALRAAGVHVAESQLIFGEVVAGSTPRRTIHLEGLPIARACTVGASPRWVRVEPTLEGFDVSVTTTHQGALRGDLKLRAPTGEVTIPVEVFIVERAEPEPFAPAPIQPERVEPEPVQPGATALEPRPAEPAPEPEPRPVASAPTAAPAPLPASVTAEQRRSDPVPGAAIVAGGLTAFLAALEYRLWNRPEAVGVALAAFQLVVYAGFRFLQAKAGSRQHQSSWLQAAVGGLALVAAIVAMANVHYSSLSDFLKVLVWFWVIAGVLGAVAARLSVPGPARGLDTAIGVLGALFAFGGGTLISNYEQDKAGVVFIIWGGLAGALLLAIGLAGNRAGTLAVDGRTGRDPVPVAGITAGVILLMAIALMFLGQFSSDAGHAALGSALIIHGVFRLIQSAAVNGVRERRAPWLALMGAMSMVTGALIIAYSARDAGDPVLVPFVVFTLAVGPVQFLAARPSAAGWGRTLEMGTAVLALVAGLVEWALYASNSGLQGFAVVIWLGALGITLIAVGLERAQAATSQ